MANGDPTAVGANRWRLAVDSMGRESQDEKTWRLTTGAGDGHLGTHGSTHPRQGSIRKGGGGVWDPKVCAPKMARLDFPFNRFRFSHDGHFGPGESNGWSAELDVPAMDNSSHCSSASSSTLSRFLLGDCPGVSANVLGCLPSACTLIVGHTLYFACRDLDSTGYVAYMQVKGQSPGVSAGSWPHSANTRGDVCGGP